MNKIKKKGVSPVIATVLLIGIVIIVGLIIFLWIRGITQEVVTKFDKNAELVCDEVNFEASYSLNSLAISNTGNVPIYEVMVKINEEGSFETKNINQLSGNWPTTGLNQGKRFVDTIIFDDATSIILVPVLLGNSKGGETAFTCNENKYGYEINL